MKVSTANKLLKITVALLIVAVILKVIAMLL